jgi:hypothetical protein
MSKLSQNLAAMVMYQRGKAPTGEQETPKKLLTQAAIKIFGNKNDTLMNLLAPALTLIHSDQIDESVELLEQMAREYKRLKAEHEQANATEFTS